MKPSSSWLKFCRALMGHAVFFGKKNNDLRHFLNSKMPLRHTFGLMCDEKQILYF
jgi:hypothetical protein